MLGRRCRDEAGLTCTHIPVAPSFRRRGHYSTQPCNMKDQCTKGLQSHQHMPTYSLIAYVQELPAAKGSQVGTTPGTACHRVQSASFDPVWPIRDGSGLAKSPSNVGVHEGQQNRASMRLKRKSRILESVDGGSSQNLPIKRHFHCRSSNLLGANRIHTIRADLRIHSWHMIRTGYQFTLTCIIITARRRRRCWCWEINLRVGAVNR